METNQPAVSGEQNVLEVTGLVKRFSGVRALAGVDFTVCAGEVHALVGENGAGKSTLIKVVTGVYQADEGEIQFNGRRIRLHGPLDAQRHGISTIYQEVNLIPLMSVARNLFLGNEPRRFGLIDVGRMNRAATQILREYGIDADVRLPLRSLGLGVQQMVALARAIQVDARLVIMDEPTSSLDAREVATLFRVIRRLRDRGVAIVYISHRLDELYEICDRVTVMRDGAVVAVSDLATLDRLRLISLMLGRDLADVRRHGATAFSTDRRTRTAPVLTARGLTRRHELAGVSVTINAGEVVGLGGLLGAGRSETAKAIAGAMAIDSGTIEVAGRVLRRHNTAAAIRAGIVMLAEDRRVEGIVGSLSVRDNIVLAALPRLSRAGLVSRARQDEVVDHFIKRFNIKISSPDQRISELSGGNQQKVLLARWLCLHPNVLLLDEPTRGIDVGAKAEVQTLIDELADDGLGVLLISSELDELLEGSDRIVVLRDGRITGELTDHDVNEQTLMRVLAAEPAAGQE